jgi:hypothetical protein
MVVELRVRLVVPVPCFLTPAEINQCDAKAPQSPSGPRRRGDTLGDQAVALVARHCGLTRDSAGSTRSGRRRTPHAPGHLGRLPERAPPAAVRPRGPPGVSLGKTWGPPGTDFFGATGDDARRMGSPDSLPRRRRTRVVVHDVRIAPGTRLVRPLQRGSAEYRELVDLLAAWVLADAHRRLAAGTHTRPGARETTPRRGARAGQ